MKNRFHSAPGATFAFGLVALLSACGGGGGDGGAAVGTTTGTGPVFTANPVFATPAGPLCSTTVQPGICTQPTSSSATEAAVMAAMRDPNSPKIRFEVSDVEGTSTIATLNGLPTSSLLSHSLKTQIVNVSRASLDVGDIEFAFDKDFDTDGERFAIDTLNYASVETGALGNIRLQSKYNSYNNQSGTPLVDLQIGGQSQFWNTTLGLLTDQNDMPTDSQITYAGNVLVTAGSNALVDSTHWQALQAQCPLTATFSPSTGILKFAPVTCAYSPTSTPTNLSFSLTDLNVLGSKIEAGIGLAASIDINAPVPTYGSFWPDPAQPIIDWKFDVAELSGIVSGQGARTIDVVGGNDSGEFHIQLVRQ